MKLILTGGTGFLGSHLLKLLLVNNFKIVVLKRSFSRLDRIDSVIQHPNLTLFDLDLENLDDLFAVSSIDFIIHTATEYGRSQSSIHALLETNFIFPMRLIELGIKYGVKGFINTDSYFNKKDSIYSYLQNYSLSKRNLVSWLRQMSSHIQVSDIILEHIYGPSDTDVKFFPKMIQDIATNELPYIPLTAGNQKRDFIYVDDVTSAYIFILHYMMKEKFKYKVFEVGTGESISVRNLVKKIKIISGSKSVLGFGDIEYRNDEIMDSKAENSNLIDLGWRPFISLENGIKKIINSH